MMRRTLMLSAAALLLLPLPARAQQRESWSWNKQVPAGRTIEIKGINGDVRASLASGSEVRVRAEKSARRSDVRQVEIVVLEHAAGVTICAVYPSERGREPNECRAGEAGRNNVRNNDVNVEFTVEVPRGLAFTARTVNGSVHAAGIVGDVHAYTVNGSIEVASAGLVHARTVNGSIDASLGRADWSDELSFQTVNGGITVAVAGTLNAEVSASTVNGDIDTDFPLTVQGRFGPRRLQGTVGNGGRTLSLTTVNGNIELRRR